MKEITILLNDDKTVSGWCEIGSIDGGFVVSVPDDFDFEILNHCTYENGVFHSFDPEPETIPPSQEERLKALESAMLAMMTGGISNV